MTYSGGATRHRSRGCIVVTAESSQAIIERHIEKDPERPWSGTERLVEYHTPVWALIGYYYHGANQHVSQVAEDYDVPEEAVKAALAFYNSDRSVKSVIDGHIAANEAA